MNTENQLEAPPYQIIEKIKLGPDDGVQMTKSLAEKAVWTLKLRDKDHSKKLLIPIYRGEAECYANPLLPSVFRIMKEDVFLEKKLLNKFSNQYPQYKSNDPLIVLSMMQHYGFPTRLLDWTRSLEIALFFACIENPEKDGFLYIFLPTMTYLKDGQYVKPIEAFTDSLRHHYSQQCFISHTEGAQKQFWKEFANRANSSTSKTSIPWWLTFNPQPKNEQNKREKWQESIFSFHLGYINNGKYYAGPPGMPAGFIQQSVSQIIIPADSKQKILSELNMVGIRTATLFPEPKFYETEYFSGTGVSKINIR